MDNEIARVLRERAREGNVQAMKQLGGGAVGDDGGRTPRQREKPQDGKPNNAPSGAVGAAGKGNGKKGDGKSNSDICKGWMKNGTCPRGDACKFKHPAKYKKKDSDTDTARSPSLSPKAKAQPTSKGKAKPPEELKNLPCFKYMEGKCDNVDRDCEYSHHPDIIAKAKEAKAQGQKVTGSFAMAVPLRNRFGDLCDESEDDFCNEDNTSC